MNPGQSIKFDNIPSDTISEIAFNNNLQNPLVCASSWDNSLTLWRLVPQGNNIPQVQYLTKINHTTAKDAILRCTFNPDNSIFYGTASGMVMQLKNGENNPTSIGKHSGIISGVHWCQNQSLLVTGSLYDFKLNFWDIRDTSKPANTIDLPAKCCALDTAGDSVVVATYATEPKVHMVDMKQTTKSLSAKSTQLNSIITSIAISPDGKGYVASSVNGAIETNLLGTGGKIIPVHRAGDEVYSSNCVAVSNLPNKNIFMSGGSNGIIEFFNKDKGVKTTEKPMTTAKVPITALAIMPGKNFYACATGNDWSRGADEKSPPMEMTLRMWSAKDSG
ncbi:hypothetical protein TRFO_39236 [Tritrichomonas foetus]|uniref:mRNA export factor n=1 Tax=Tritrichomonas foetus TaxID=1144522 RepID=A0A1J4J8K1_9EUKA|nr:hypothetical protein TRFO_39236 [Tritrichomonas foetus]|eukprot:OHS94567.1 hypothetical protein TRFO_39236 [Tritrichomonas foetus]